MTSRVLSFALLASCLVVAGGCGSSRDRRGGPGTGRDGSVVTPPAGPVLEGALTAANGLADEICPCQVMSGDYSTVEECRADQLPDERLRCMRELYPSMQSADLDAAIRCQSDGATSLTSCVRSMGCENALSCLSTITECPSSAAFEAFDAAVDDCEGGVDPPPTTCAPAGSSSGVGSSIFSGSTAGGASVRTGSCGGSGPEVVYAWTAPAAGGYTIDTIGSDFDTVLYAFDGSCTGEELDCNDDASSVQSQITVTVSAGQVLYVVVDSYSSSGGAFVVNITPAS